MILMTLAVKGSNANAIFKATFYWNTFWIYSALLDQVDGPPSSRIRRTGWALVCKGLFLLALGIAFVLNNNYRAVLNVNAVAGNELLSSFARLSQLENFTWLYIPMGECAWNRNKKLLLSGEHIKAMKSGSYPCSFRLGSLGCKRPVGGTSCLLRSKYYTLLTMTTSPCRVVLQKLNKSDAELGRTLEDCKDESVHSMLKYNRKLKFFPEAQLSSYVRHEMLEPKTAMLITGEALPDVWNEFEKAMAHDRSLKFSHNYFTDDNYWMLNRGSRLVVACGLPKDQNIFSHRVHNLLTSGTWDFWVSLDSWKKEKRSNGCWNWLKAANDLARRRVKKREDMWL